MADHYAIVAMLKEHFDVEATRATTAPQALTLLKSSPFDLVLVNRILDGDYSQGLDLIRQIKCDPDCSSIPVMMITNYSEHQQAAVAAGAEAGFGKRELGTESTLAKLRRWLT